MDYYDLSSGVSYMDPAGSKKSFSTHVLLTEIWDDGTRLAEYGYYPDGRIREVQHGPIRQSYGYDTDKNLISLRVEAGGTLLSDSLYAYDGNGNRIGKSMSGKETRYLYDSLDQLVKVEYPTGSEELFYDRAGNRTKRSLSGGEELYSYDSRNRLMSLSTKDGEISFRYDPAGNLLEDGKARYEYDAFNRMVKAETFDGEVQGNRYDPEGLRHEMEENGKLVQFIFHKGEVIAEQEEGERVTRFIRGSELIARQTDYARTYYHYASDEMGSVAYLTDGDGKVENRYEYDAWGNVMEAEEGIPNRFQFTGEQLDPVTQQYYLRARFYNPVIARFTQEDTYRGDGLNLYAYCRNNPVYYVDPSGQYRQCVKDAYDQIRKKNPEMSAQEAYAAAKKQVGVEITLQHKQGMPINEFERKAKELQALGEKGLLYKAENPVSRDPNVTKKYRQDMIKRIYEQYNEKNPEFSNKLIYRVTNKMQPDHVWELQLGGPDTSSNLKFLDSFTNWHIGTQQIRPQIRNLDTGTKITIKILNSEGGIFER